MSPAHIKASEVVTVFTTCKVHVICNSVNLTTDRCNCQGDIQVLWFSFILDKKYHRGHFTYLLHDYCWGLNLVGFSFLIHWRYKYIKQMFFFHILDGRLYLKTTVMYWIFPAENTCATVKNIAVRHWLIRSSVETKRFQTNFLNFIYQCSSKM